MKAKRKKRLKSMKIKTETLSWLLCKEAERKQFTEKKKAIV